MKYLGSCIAPFVYTYFLFIYEIWETIGRFWSELSSTILRVSLSCSLSSFKHEYSAILTRSSPSKEPEGTGEEVEGADEEVQEPQQQEELAADLRHSECDAAPRLGLRRAWSWYGTVMVIARVETKYGTIVVIGNNQRRVKMSWLILVQFVYSMSIMDYDLWFLCLDPLN